MSVEYINCGCVDWRGKRIPTKKALKELVAKIASGAIDADSDGVLFDQTSMVMSDRIPGNATIRDLSNAPAGTELSVIGPDPYTKRTWYATIKLDKTGKVVCV